MNVLWLAVPVVTAYLTVGAFLYFQQSKMLFPAPKNYPNESPENAGVRFEDLRIGGVHAWWIPADAGAKTAVMFHGNAQVIENMIPTGLKQLRELGLNLLLVDYRGYGLSAPISPDESTVDDDADASLDYLLRDRKIAPKDIFVIGASIGSGPAVYLAAKHADLGGLILESPISSIDDVARNVWHLRIFPVGLLLRTHFDNRDRIGSVHVPLLMAVGSADQVTPTRMADELFARANEPKKLVIVEKAGHNDLAPVGGTKLRDEILAYLFGSVNR